MGALISRESGATTPQSDGQPANSGTNNVENANDSNNSIINSNSRRRRRRTSTSDHYDSGSTHAIRRQRTESMAHSPVVMDTSADAALQSTSTTEQPRRRSPRLIERQSSLQSLPAQQNQLREDPLQGVVRQGESAYSHEILRQSLAIILYNLLIEQQSLRDIARTQQQASNGTTTAAATGEDIRPPSAISESSRVNAFYFCGNFQVAVRPPLPLSTAVAANNDNSNNNQPIAGAVNGVLDISGSIDSFSRQFSQQHRQAESFWVNQSALAVQLNHPSIESTTIAAAETADVETTRPNSNVENGRRTERPLGPLITLPMIVIGVRDPQQQQQQQQQQEQINPSGNGWVMYVVGGPSTSESLEQIERLLEENRSAQHGPEIHGINGRFVLSLDAALAAGSTTASEAPTATAAENNAQRRPASVASAVLNSLATNAASAGSAGDGGNGTFGLALFSLLFGLLNGTDGPASEWDLGVHEWARDGVTRGDSSSDEGDGDESSETEELNNSIGAANHSNYELFLRLAELIGPARPRHVPLDAVDRALPAVKYIALKSSRVVGDETCRICLTDYERDDDVRPLQCDHLFHKYCIDTWLSKHVNSCPLCRQKAVVESDGTVVNQKEE